METTPRKSHWTRGEGPEGAQGPLDPQRSTRTNVAHKGPHWARKRTATAVASDALWRTDAPRVAPGLVQSRTLADRGPHPGQPPHLRVHTRQVGRCRHDRVLDIPPRGQAAERRHFDRARRNRGRKDPDARPRGTPACPRGAWPARRSGGARRVVMRAPAIARCADGGTLPPGGVDL